MTEASRSPPEPHPQRAVQAGLGGKIVPNTGSEDRRGGLRLDAELPVGKEGECGSAPPDHEGVSQSPQRRPRALDRDGWVPHAADVGYVDDEGYFFIVDRTKELIKYKGLQVAPPTGGAAAHASRILDAAVVADRRTRKRAKVPKATWCSRPDDARRRPTPADAIMGWVAQRVAPHQAHPPPRVHRPDPEVGLGKILRRC